MPNLRAVAAFSLAFLVAGIAPTACAQVSKGNQILINRGFQVQGMISNFDPFHLATYSNANYTAMNWIWDSTPSAMGNPPGFPWARWVRTNSPSEMPPLGSESSYMSQYIAMQLGDELELNDGPTRTNLANWFNAVRTNWPNTILFHNNYGGQVGDAQLGDFIVRAQPDMISFDSYPFRVDGSSNPYSTVVNWYGDLRRYREFAKNHNIPLATYMQTYYSGSEGTRSPSPSELRLQHFAALAFNAKMLIDFTYNGGSSAFFTNSFGGDNAPNSLYYEKTDAALRVRNFGKALVLLKPVNDAVFNTWTTGMLFIRGRDPNGNINPFPIGFYAGPGGADPYTDWVYQRNDPYLTNNWTVTNKGTKNNGQPGDVIIAWFKLLDETYDGASYTNETYMMVVNGLSDPTGTATNCLQEIRLNFATSFLALEVLNPTNGNVQVQPLPLTNGLRQLVLNLSGGDAALFKFSDGAPFVGSQIVGAPVFTAQPASRTNLLGSDALFSGFAAGSLPLTYQWQFNGTNISGATTNTYTRTNVQVVDAGSYALVASNSLGMATSTIAVLTVNYAPQISAQPQSRTVAPGSNVLFSVAASGVPASLTYQWRFNGTNISGATLSAYTRTNAQSADSGSYSVIASNNIGATTSSNAILIVNGAPVILVPPQELAVLAGANAGFNVTATGANPITYQWLKDGLTLTNNAKFSGVTTSSLAVSNIQSADLGLYSVILSNSFGTTSSVPVGLALASLPAIITQPQSLTNNAGTLATFGVVATGNGLSYRWQRAGTNLADGGNISGSAGPALAVGGVSRFDATNYLVVITNAAGGVTSAPASLTVVFALPLQEPFNYPAGSVLSNQMSPDFLTWTDVGTTNAGPVISNVLGNLDVAGLTASSGNSIRFGGLGKSARLSFVSGHPVTNGNLYFSFALKVLDLTGASSAGGFFAGFNNSIGTQGNTPTVVAPRLYMRATNGGFNLGVAKSTDTTTDWVWDNTLYNVNQTVFIVGGYTFNSVDVTTDDFCKLWINPNPSTFGAANAPASTLTALNGNDIGANQIASFVFFQRSASVEAAAMVADELRIDTTWAGVTPAPAPAIISQPSNRTNNPGTTATFTVGASGGNLKYQWLRNGLPLANAGNVSGATGPTLTVSAVTPGDAAIYSVVVSTGGGSAISTPALLVVNVPPSISMQPQNQSANVGTLAVFAVAAGGTAPLSFQWRFNGTNLAGATTSDYNLPNVQRTNAGTYSVSVTNIAGNILSSNASLTVYPITPVLMSGITLLSGGRLKLQGSGDPGQFVLQTSSNLLNWSDLTNIMGADGTFEYVDEATNYSARFFRAKLYP